MKHRAQAFFDLYDKGLIRSTSIDIEKSDQITNVLDSIVIKLEGGLDYDLKCLETNEEPTTTPNDGAEASSTAVAAAETYDKPDEEQSKVTKDDENMVVEKENGELAGNGSEEDPNVTEQTKSEDQALSPVDETKEDKSADEEMVCEEKKDEPSDGTKEDGEADDSQSEVDDSKHLTSDQQAEQNCDQESSKVDKKEQEINNNDIDKKELNNKVDETNAPRPLHKTVSIFLRYLPSNVTKSEVVKMFQAYDGYLRVALADPTFDKRFQRRGWCTFDRNVDIRKVYLSLTNVKIRDCEFGAIINRDLSRRIRSVNGIASHRNCVLADLKHTTQIILNLDEERRVFENDEESSNQEPSLISSTVIEPPKESEEEKAEQTDEQHDQPNVNQSEQTAINADNEQQDASPPQPVQEAVKNVPVPVYKVEGLVEKITVFGQETRNPLLVDIEQCLKEKSDAATDTVNEETGEIKEEASELEPKQLERDEELLRVLDKLVFYLRVVHSLDYYNHIDYPNEDEMPNRIGIMHARGMVPTADITLKEVNDYMRQFSNRIAPYLERNELLGEDEIEKLGKRKIEAEIEKFIADNTKELKADKWLCPLSGKKFKGPSFVRKHIETKHQDKLDQVRQEVEFFNFYLADPRRPQLAEHPFNKTGYKSQQSSQTSSTDHHSTSNSHSNYSNNVHQRVNFNPGGNRYNSGGGGWNNSRNYNNYNNYQNGGNRFNNRFDIFFF